MTRKEQNKILGDKIESNINQYKVDRLNAEISAFSSGDLNKYEFLTRKDLKYKPNALDKARFEFSPLGKTVSTGLDKTAQGYQEEGIIKLLKDIRDVLAGCITPRALGEPRGPGLDRSDDDSDDDNMPDLETEEEAAKRIAKTSEDKVFDVLNKFKNNMENKMGNLDKMVMSKENEWNTKLNKLNNDAKKIDNYIKRNNDVKKELDIVEKERNKVLLKLNQSNEEKNMIRDELKRIEDELNKKSDDIDKKKLNDELINFKKNLN